MRKTEQEINTEHGLRNMLLVESLVIGSHATETQIKNGCARRTALFPRRCVQKSGQEIIDYEWASGFLEVMSVSHSIGHLY